MIKKFLFIYVFFSSLILGTSKEEIANQIRDLISKLPPNSVSGILIYNPLMQDTIFALNELRPMTPASLTKLFTTSTSLGVMGGEHNLSTKLFSDDLDFSDGVLNGNLYIKGYGNSVFTQSDINGLVDELVSKGIKSITGSIIGDDYFFDDVYTREDWIEDEGANIKLPPISALVLDRNKKTIKKKIRRRYRFVTEMVKDPPLNIAIRFSEELQANGIIVTGKPLKGTTPTKPISLG